MILPEAINYRRPLYYLALSDLILWQTAFTGLIEKIGVERRVYIRP